MIKIEKLAPRMWAGNGFGYTSAEHKEKTMLKLYSIVYRTGGTLNCKWTRVLDAYPFDLAKEKASEIARMGYRTVIHDTDTLRALGLPIGWEPDSVDWVNDHIVADSYETHHIKGL